MVRPFPGGVILHSVLHFSKCSSGAPCPSYFCNWLLPYYAPNLMRSNHLHWYQSLTISLFSPHHIACVSFSSISNAKSLLFSNTSSLYCVNNVSNSFTPWKLGGSLISVPTHLTARSILAHIVVDTFLNLYC
jgi:hypothetical protein